MADDALRNAFTDLVYLISCILNCRTPESARISQIDLSELYQVSEKHLLSGIAAIGLEKAGIRDERFTQALGKAVRKEALFDLEREAVLKALDDAGILHIPLKGAVIKDLYPRIGMRQMSDNDILVDPERMKDVDQIMKSLGFKKGHESQTHVKYLKSPVLNFEMHRRLFDEKRCPEFGRYYQNITEKLLKNEADNAGYHFSDEDFYIYMTAHESKHYSNSGTGLRSLVDIYVYWKKKENTLDRVYIETELVKMDLLEFEKQSRSLAFHLFNEETLTDQDYEMLKYIQNSGTYGTRKNMVDNQISRYGGGKKGKLRYILHRIFLPMDSIRNSYPIFLKIPILLPFLPFYRAVLRLDSMKEELKILKQRKNNHE